MGGGRTEFVPGFQPGDSEYFFETVPAFGELGEGGQYVAAWVEGGGLGEAEVGMKLRVGGEGEG